MVKTSWNKVADWYKKEVGEKGHYYHQKVILPNLLRLLDLKTGVRVIDLGCGQGVLGRAMPTGVEYTGVDAAMDLINEAKSLDKNLKHQYMVRDITERLDIFCRDARSRVSTNFDRAVMLLTLQNLKRPFKVIENARNLLKNNGQLVIVINHPCFRIPKHSDWETDKTRRVQWRKTDVYMSKTEIPIDSSPFDKKNNQTTFSYHYPLSAYAEMLSDNGFTIEAIEEWVSDKKSEGGMAKIEDTARKEFPLFMAIVARKLA